MSCYEPCGIFREGFTLTEVQALLVTAKAALIEDPSGEHVVSWSSSGHQSASRTQLPPTHLMAEVLYALKLLDPENYPPDADRAQVEFTS